MSELLILTNCFPFSTGEQFFESEVPYWKSSNFSSVYICPRKQSGAMRTFPEGIGLIRSKAKYSFKLYRGLEKSFFLVKALMRRYFYNELIFYFRVGSRPIAINVVIELVKQCAAFEEEKARIFRVLKRFKEPPNVYAYWNHLSCYAACYWKKKGLVRKVVSRAHGFDVYEERRIGCYLPLKRQFKDSMDCTFLIASQNSKYFEERYGFHTNKLRVSRLGVFPKRLPLVKAPKGNGVVNVLTISACIPLKRLDRIADALAIYARRNPKLHIKWHHLGGGKLYSEILRMVKNFHIDNLEIDASGQIDNTKVLKMLDMEYFDVFINASESEGVPVSIMEAMGHGIPAVAPNVGGVSELVNDDRGYLMPEKCSPNDILRGIEWVIISRNNQDMRLRAYDFISRNYNANINYRIFVKEVEQVLL